MDGSLFVNRLQSESFLNSFSKYVTITGTLSNGTKVDRKYHGKIVNLLHFERMKSIQIVIPTYSSVVLHKMVQVAERQLVSRYISYNNLLSFNVGCRLLQFPCLLFPKAFLA
jgi:hypothetical protein